VTHAEDAHQLFAQAVGRPEGSGAWLAITQERVDAFADVTEDHQFIHVDPAAAEQYSPWGTTIAHGFLTLSLLTVLTSTIEQPTERAAGLVMGVNYGFDKVRFVNPVKVGARIRASTVLASADLKDPSNLQVVRTVTVEIEGEAKPALVADWVTRLVYS